MGNCLSQYSIAVKRHHEHSNSYKGKHLLGWLQRFSPLALGREIWQSIGSRHGAGERAESFRSGATGSRKLQ